MPGGVLAPRMSDPRVHPRLVVRRPEADAIAEARSDRLRVVDERLGRRALAPAALVLEYLRRVPVEEGREGLDPLLEQRVDEPVVEVESGVVHAAAAVGEYPRPRDREAERVEAELAHELHVVAVPVVEVARDLARVAAAHLAGSR